MYMSAQIGGLEGGEGEGEAGEADFAATRCVWEVVCALTRS